MSISFHLIHGLSFGIEHVSKDIEEDIFESCIVADFAFVRCIIGVGDFDNE